MLCYRCGSHVPDGTETCGTCGQKFALGLKPGPIAGFGTGTRRHRIAVESSPYKVGDVLQNRYQIKDNVGAGPLGWVFKCIDRDIDVDVALKVVSPRFLQASEEREALASELKAARKLGHPNIVRVYEDGEDQGRLFFTMQHLEGLTLRRIWDLRRQKGQLFALREVEPIVSQIAQGLEAAQPLMSHGDLKPDNILVLPDLLKITDFGLANALPRGPFMAAQKTGGVHRYLAPEFLHGQRIEPRGDVFGLGVILGEMLAGSPFEGQGFDLLARNPTLPREVDLIFRKAVAFKPQDRFEDTGALALAITEAMGGQATPRVRQAGQTAPQFTPIDRPRPAEPASSERSAGTEPPSSGPVQPPPAAGDISLREKTEEVEDQQIQEAKAVEEPPAAPKTEAQKPAGGGALVPVERREMPAPSAAAVQPHDTPVAEHKPVQAPAPKPVSPAPPATPARGAPVPPAKDRPAAREQPSAKALSGPKKKVPAAPAPPAAKKPDRPKAPSPGKSAPAQKESSRPAAAPPPGRPPNRPSDNAPKVLAAGLVVVIIGVFAYLVVQGVHHPRASSSGGPVATAKPVVTPHPPPPTPVATAAPAADAGSAEVVIAPAPKAPTETASAHTPPASTAPVAVSDATATDEPPTKAPAADDRHQPPDAKAKAALDAQAREAAKKKADEAAAKERAAKEAAKKKAEEEAKAAAHSQPPDAAVVASAETSRCPSGMRYVPAGTFLFGAPNSDDLKNFGDLDATSRHEHAFCIDVYESPDRRGARPTALVTYAQAERSCRRRGQRLCREDEWERACKGPDDLRFPYGKNFVASACDTAGSDLNARPVSGTGTHRECVSGFGVFDLAGNVAEWTSSTFAEGERVVKGGSAAQPDYDSRCAARAGKSPRTRDRMIGFRCCADPR